MRWLVILFVLTGAVASARHASDQALARRLADPNTRESAVAEVVSSGNRKVPLLLSWTRKPPAGIGNSYEQYQLYVGLADVFGELRTEAAIPFLIKYIGIDRTPMGNSWMKTPNVVEHRMAAVKALMRIGKVASLAVIQASSDGHMTGEDRLAAIYVVSSVRDVPEARIFLYEALGEANLQRHWAEDGISSLEGGH